MSTTSLPEGASASAQSAAGAGVPTAEQVTRALATVQDPEIHRPITELGMVKDVQVAADGSVRVDGDGQHDPGQLGRVLEPVLRGDADIAVGSRFAADEARAAGHTLEKECLLCRSS